MLSGNLVWAHPTFLLPRKKNLVKTQGCMKQEAVRCSKFQDDWSCRAYQPSTNFATLLLARRKFRKIVLCFEPNVKHWAQCETSEFQNCIIIKQKYQHGKSREKHTAKISEQKNSWKAARLGGLKLNLQNKVRIIFWNMYFLEVRV